MSKSLVAAKRARIRKLAGRTRKREDGWGGSSDGGGMKSWTDNLATEV